MSRRTVERRALKLFAFVTLFMPLSIAQTRAQEASQYDRGTPPQHAAGLGSMGSYVSADLGTVNLSNGSLNFKLMLGRVGGRGFSLPLTLNYSSKLWSANMGEDVVSDPFFRKFKAAYAVYDNPETPTDYYQKVAPGWTLGAAPALHAVGVSINPVQNRNGCSEALNALVKLTVVLPDRGEVELRDDWTDGSPLTAQPDATGCRRMDGYRGQRWHATDGSGIVFVNDVDNGVVNGNLNGTLITSDGTRYRFRDTAPNHFGSIFMNEFARADLVTDRQGNRIEISYTTLQTAPYTATIRFTDQLGRVTTVELNALDPANGSVLAALVTLPGFGGASRQYKVRKGVMNQHYRAGINPTLPVYNGDSPGREMNCMRSEAHTSLFSGSWCGGLERLDDREVLTELVLPDASALVFKYDEFGEVAEARMPTGGRVQYDYAYRETLPSGNSPLFETVPAPGTGNVRQVDRAVVARRIYPDGQTAAAHWSYEYTATPGVGGAASEGVTEVIARASDNVTILARQKHYFLNGARFLDSNGGTGYASWTTGLERRSETLSAAGAVLSAQEQDWSQRAPVNWGAFPAEQIANDNRVNAERNYLDDGKVSKVTTLYDEFNNPTDVYEYDYGQGAPAAHPTRHTRTSYLRVNPSNGINYVDRNINLLSLPESRQVYAVNTATGVETLIAQSETKYDEASYPTLTYAAVTGWATPPTAARGAATTSRRWLDQTNTWIETHTQFDQTGNVRSTWNGRGNRWQVSYEDSFSDGANARQTYAFATQTISPIPDPTGAHASNAPLVSNVVYDFSSGLVTSSTDVNGQTTTYEYQDPLDRLTRVNLPGGGRTRYEYGVTAGSLYLRTRTLLRQTPNVEETDAYVYFDGFGRTLRSYVYDGTPSTPWVAVQTDYEALGRVSRVSNPYRVTNHGVAGTPAHWTTTAYDEQGRILAVTTADGATEKSAYKGNEVTLTDQAGRTRRTTADALGRLTRVVEDPSGLEYQTDYTYDALDNLRLVQQGAQQRFFMYDSLGSLIRAKNPEQSALPALALSDPVTGNSQWSLAYSYDEAGNVRFRTDPRNMTTEHRYDALNRNIITLYPDTADPSNDTADIERLYDGAPLGKGRPWQAWTWGQRRAKTVVGAYNAAGQTLVQYQYQHDGTQWSQAFTAHRELDLAGNVVKQIYPSGRSVVYTYNSAGRLAAFSGNLAGAPRSYSSEVSYNETGGLKQETFGTDTPLYHKLHYNVRGQLYDVRLSTHSLTSNEWDWNRGALVNYYSNNYQWGGAPGALGSGADNNGNLLRSEIFVPANDQISAFTASRQSFSYDPLNRLTSVAESRFTNWTDPPTPQFAQTYTFDRYNNRTVNAAETWGGVPEPQFSVDPTTNRLGVPGGQTGNLTYDAGGNLVNDSYTSYGRNDSTATRFYDAENRLFKVKDAALQEVSAYTFDPDGRRVRRRVGAQEVWQIYGMGGELLAEYAAGASPASPQKEYGYRSGELLIVATGDATQTATSVAGGLPYAGTARTIPGTIEAEHYDEGGAGVAYQDTTGGNSGLNYDASGSPPCAYRTPTDVDVYQWSGYSGSYLVLSHAGDWMRYTVDVSTSGTYDLQMRVAWGGTAGVLGKFHVEVDGVDKTGPILMPDTNWTLTNITKTGVELSAGRHVIRVVADTNADNGVMGDIDYLKFDLRTAAPQQPQTADISWVVTDHLGTPRMFVDKTGSLSGIKRHDYLPFGEELVAGVGGRTAQQGYVGDSNRFKFVSYERDWETGLDYAGARYFGLTMGRFTSVDPLMSSGTLYDPQTWNRYSYAINNPLKWTDPTGLYVWSNSLGGNVSDEELRRRAGNDRRALGEANRIIERRNDFREALANAGRAANALEGAERDLVSQSVAAYGAEGTANGVSVGQERLSSGVAAEARVSFQTDSQAPYATSANVEVVINDRGDGNLASAVGHEGRHAADAQAIAAAMSAEVAGGGTGENAVGGDLNRTRYEREVRGYNVTSLVAQGLGLPHLSVGRREIWNRGWTQAERATRRSAAINNHLDESPTYRLTPENPGERFFPRP